ncbi:hypothetical protein TW95_gp0583 [Pandoravirus inopinatum]|uniref:Uncharacterized protein n=1 Tax=Pandoravirus inopinatum TaxID=1605721 RepID=A0A0B5JCG6_9VIRU|nr:hypothetical protein TW95_gp0583 [Pandoravirus inopinatum]AJF97317.1 hypothetical protein [Pandoravirus inopinatum]
MSVIVGPRPVGAAAATLRLLAGGPCIAIIVLPWSIFFWSLLSPLFLLVFSYAVASAERRPRIAALGPFHFFLLDHKRIGPITSQGHCPVGCSMRKKIVVRKDRTRSATGRSTSERHWFFCIMNKLLQKNEQPITFVSNPTPFQVNSNTPCVWF